MALSSFPFLAVSLLLHTTSSLADPSSRNRRTSLLNVRGVGPHPTPPPSGKGGKGKGESLTAPTEPPVFLGEGAPSPVVAPTGFPTASPEESKTPGPTVWPTPGPVPVSTMGPVIVSASSAPVATTEATPVSPAPQGSVVLPSTAVSCPGLSADRKQEVWWEYAMTLSDSSGDANGDPNYIGATDLARSLELVLQSSLEQDMLSCSSNNNQVRSRRLQADLGISALDYLPLDVLQETACPSGLSHCFVFRGLMDIFLNDTASEGVAVLETRKSISSLFGTSGAIQVAGIESVEYLRPSLSGASNSVESSNSGGDTNNVEGSTLGSGTAVVIALSAGLVVIAAFTTYFYKRRGSIDDETTNGPLTVGTSSQVKEACSELSPRQESMDENSTSLGDNFTSSTNSPRSPFSQILPGAYQLHDPETMSAILEDSDSASAATSSDIIVSECGYSEQDSNDMSYMLEAENANTPMLGAQPIDDYEDEQEDFLFDTGSFSPSMSEPAENPSLTGTGTHTTPSLALMASRMASTPTKGAVGSEFTDPLPSPGDF